MAERMHEWRERRLPAQRSPRFRTRGLMTFSLLALLLLLGYMFLKGKVVRVVNGDTVQAIAPGGRLETLRLYGIVAPAGSEGEKAAAFIKSAVLLREAEIIRLMQDHPGSAAALIVLPDGLVLNEELIRQGLALVSPQFCDQAFCASWLLMEQEARAAGRGLWADASFLPPEESAEPPTP